MRRTMLGGKIHRAVVTHADLEYEGSVSIDSELMSAADFLPHQEVQVWNVTRGTRLSTYALPAPAGSGVICVNGAAAHHNQPGDLVILAAFVELDDAEARAHQPRVVRVDGRNRMVSGDPEVAGPDRPVLRAARG